MDKSRLIARVIPRTFKDWVGKSGQLFRDGIDVIVKKLDDPDIRKKREELKDLAWKKVSGAASAEYFEALKNAAEEENIKTLSCLAKRTEEHNVRIAGAHAEQEELRSFNMLLDTFERLGLAIHVDDDLNIQIMKSSKEIRKKAV